MYFQKYGLRKRWLDKCLKNLVSEDTFTSNIAKGLKRCCNVSDSTITTFIDHCEHNSVVKSLF